MDAQIDEQQETGLKARVQRHPITVFLVLALGSVYLLSIIPILMQYDVIPGKNLPARLGLDMERFSAAVLTVLLFSSALLVTYLCGGRRDIRQFFRRILRWKVSIGWWLTAFLALPLLTVVIAVLLGDSAVVPSGSVLWQEVLGIAIAFLLINLWEEAAWAGFLQTRLERRHNFFLAALLTGIPFAAIHMPLQVITGQVRSAVDFAVGFALLMVLVIIVRSLYGMVLRGAANSLLLVGLSHTMFNRSNNTDGIARHPGRGQPTDRRPTCHGGPGRSAGTCSAQQAEPVLPTRARCRRGEYCLTTPTCRTTVLTRRHP
jgi:membrane protease YdiL (CAAX protease family)